MCGFSPPSTAPAPKRRLSLFAHVPLSADIASQTLWTNPPGSGAPDLSAATPACSMAGVARSAASAASITARTSATNVFHKGDQATLFQRRFIGIKAMERAPRTGSGFQPWIVRHDISRELPVAEAAVPLVMPTTPVRLPPLHAIRTFRAEGILALAADGGGSSSSSGRRFRRLAAGLLRRRANDWEKVS